MRRAWLIALLIGAVFSIVLERCSTLEGYSGILKSWTLIFSSIATSTKPEIKITPRTRLRGNNDVPQLLRDHAGLYLDKTRAPELSNALLLTAANYGYMDMLRNWECYARKLGLDWLVVALDDQVYQELGPERSFLTVGERHGSYERFGSPGFKIVGCNKLRSMLSVLVETQLDVVFSDGDSVFKSDPFLPSLSLGSMMRSGKYDMIYGRKIIPPGAKKDEYHQEPIKGNTGFYYVSGGRKPRIMQRMFNISIQWCDKRPDQDDQENFWDALVVERKRKPRDKDFFACFRHCDSTQCSGIEGDKVFDYCDMSPWEYLDGAIQPTDALKAPYHMVSYHATWVFGKEKKQQKLKTVELWDPACASKAFKGEVVASALPANSASLMPQTVQSETAVVQSGGQLPQLLRKHAGLYLDKTRAPELSNALLLTAANYGYMDMLRNWECYARKLGLDWLVVALDDQVYQELGPERSFLTVGERHGSYERFGSPGFKIVGCNKLRSMLYVLLETQLDVVFSDGDSVFKSDPFLPSLSLGSMMRSGKYDMIYGRKIIPPGAKKDEYHQEPIKGNTGFYYVSGGRKPRIMQRMFNISIQWCDKRPDQDDQENFWDALVVERKRKPRDKDFFACFRHCDSTQCSGVEGDKVFDYCDMSPWEFLDGAIDPTDALKAPYHMVSYHATWVFGKEKKQQKLKTVELWDPACASKAFKGEVVASALPANSASLMPQTVQSETAVVQSGGQLPQLLRKHAGLYLDKTRAPELSNALLLTAANYGYLDMLQNWECYARKFGLDWLVVALDDKIYQELGPERSFLTVGERHGSYERFGSPGFQIVGCNKLRSMLYVLLETQLDVVFSDGDSVFKSDPFLPSLSLGSMMRSGKYDMIYGRKIKPPGPRTDEHHQEPIKGNTGFYYVSGGRKPRIMQRMFNISIHWCNNRPGLDDQENFWDALVVERKRKPKDKEFFACFRHCDSTQCSGVEGDKVFDYCDMNPWEYIDGAVDPRLALQEPYHMVSYHSTWVIGKEAKQKKLKGAGLWNPVCGKT